MNQIKYNIGLSVYEEIFELLKQYCADRDCDIPSAVESILYERLVEDSPLVPSTPTQTVLRSRVDYLTGRVHENSDRIACVCRKIEKLEEIISELQHSTSTN